MNMNDLRPAGNYAQKYGVKMLAYGPPGSGKTPIINTAPRPVLLFCEPGLLSMKGSNVASYPGFSVKAVDDFFEWVCKSNEVRNFDTIGVDSVSQMAEICLAEELVKQRDPRKAYGNMSQWVMKHLSMLYFMQNKHAYLIAKEARVDNGDQQGVKAYFPGQDLGVKVPHLYDLIARIAQTVVPGQVNKVTAIRCRESGYEHARDRSNMLNELEPPNLAKLFAKVMAN